MKRCPSPNFLMGRALDMLQGKLDSTCSGEMGRGFGDYKGHTQGRNMFPTEGKVDAATWAALCSAKNNVWFFKLRIGIGRGWLALTEEGKGIWRPQYPGEQERSLWVRRWKDPPTTHTFPPLSSTARLRQSLCREEQYRREAFSFFLWEACSVNLLTELDNIFNEISVAHQGFWGDTWEESEEELMRSAFRGFWTRLWRDWHRSQKRGWWKSQCYVEDDIATLSVRVLGVGGIKWLAQGCMWSWVGYFLPHGNSSQVPYGLNFPSRIHISIFLNFSPGHTLQISPRPYPLCILSSSEAVWLN